MSRDNVSTAGAGVGDPPLAHARSGTCKTPVTEGWLSCRRCRNPVHQQKQGTRPHGSLMPPACIPWPYRGSACGSGGPRVGYATATRSVPYCSTRRSAVDSRSARGRECFAGTRRTREKVWNTPVIRCGCGYSDVLFCKVQAKRKRGGIRTSQSTSAVWYQRDGSSYYYMD